MLRPPINRAMRVLNRSVFQQDLLISAAKIFDIKNTSRIRTNLAKSSDELEVRNVKPLQPDYTEPIESNKKCLLLKPEIKHNDKSTWTDNVVRHVDSGEISIIPYSLHLGYENWSAHQILEAILPEELLGDIPTSFQHIGHIAQFNLRDAYLPYKRIIAEVTMDKNPMIRTVVNKVDTLGESNEFRVLDYELLAGPDETVVEHKEWGSTYRFDFSRVFWNSRLSGEHQRLAEKFKKGEAICDVMAGVGPFAIPAARLGVFAWANDLNPDCFHGLVESIALNRVSAFVQPFQMDGHDLIPWSAKELLNTTTTVKVPMKISRKEAEQAGLKPSERYNTVTWPKVFSHYIMNLPQSAVDFLPDFAGLYAGHEDLFEPHTATRLPMVHCFTFGPKGEAESTANPAYALRFVCDKLSQKLGHSLSPDDPELELCDVRDVAPNKRQYCLSFRLPAEIAFKTVDKPLGEDGSAPFAESSAQTTQSVPPR